MRSKTLAIDVFAHVIWKLKDFLDFSFTTPGEYFDNDTLKQHNLDK